MKLPEIPKTLRLAVAAQGLQFTAVGRYILRTQGRINDLCRRLVPHTMTDGQFQTLQKDAQRIYSEHPPDAAEITAMFVLETMARHVYEDWSAGKREFGYEPEPHHKWAWDGDKCICWLQKKTLFEKGMGYFPGGKRLVIYRLSNGVRTLFKWDYIDTGQNPKKVHHGKDDEFYTTLFMAQRQGLRWYYNNLRAGLIQERV